MEIESPFSHHHQYNHSFTVFFLSSFKFSNVSCRHTHTNSETWFHLEPKNKLPNVKSSGFYHFQFKFFSSSLFQVSERETIFFLTTQNVLGMSIRSTHTHTHTLIYFETLKEKFTGRIKQARKNKSFYPDELTGMIFTVITKKLTFFSIFFRFWTLYIIIDW